MNAYVVYEEGYDEARWIKAVYLRESNAVEACQEYGVYHYYDTVPLHD